LLRPKFGAFAEMRAMRLRLTECAADEAAARDEASALNLASALVRLTRSIAANGNSAGCRHFAVSMLVPDASDSAIAERVDRLLHFDARTQRSTSSRWAAGTLILLVVMLLVVASSTEVQSLCYHAFERLVALN